MKTFFLTIFALLAMASLALAAPFLVCDPQAGVTTYRLTGPAWVPATAPAQTDGSLRLDVTSATVGANSLTIAACNTDPVWGEACSATVPFSFTRPAKPTTPGSIRLIP